jgi:signal transduction histidine kinase
MEAKSQAQVRGSYRRWSPALGVGLGLAVLAAALVWSGLRLRNHIRAQIADRDGKILDAVAAMQYLNDKTNDETIASLDDPGEQMQIALEISRLRNVIGVRLFSPEGQFVNAFPAYITEAAVSATDMATLRTFQPVSRYLPKARLQEHDLLAAEDDAPVPLLVVNIPLRVEGGVRLGGVAQFLMNGTSIAQEYARLDRQLAIQSFLAFLAGGSILAGGLALAFRRVQRANRLLAERTSTLLQANRELALAAKTSAVGALTSHLIHGLKNPLSGLQSFVQDQALEQSNGHDSDWELAVATTQRMERLINRVVCVLQEQPAVKDYEVSLVEVCEMLSGRVMPAANAAQIRFVSEVAASGTVSSREADLILLILENLIQNAIEATPAGKTVRFTVASEAGSVAMEVQDEGPGLAPEVASRLFTPCASLKKGGSGIGLAISRQLAQHLGAELELKQSSSQGCVFRMTLRALEAKAKGEPVATPSGV